MKGRKIIKTASEEFGEYTWNPELKNMTSLNLSYDHESGQGCYMMSMEPGAVTEIHTHERREEYLILEGDLIEPDGTVLGPGDFVIMEPGTRHNSRTETGCFILGIDYSWSKDSV